MYIITLSLKLRSHAIYKHPLSVSNSSPFLILNATCNNILYKLWNTI